MRWINVEFWPWRWPERAFTAAFGVGWPPRIWSRRLAPNDFYAWHNYGHLNYSSGDLGMLYDHSNALRAVTAFTKAIALNPKSARTYMGRGWAYLTMNDQAHANADFQTALQLDSSLRPDLEREVRNIQERKQQVAAARGTVEQMGRYSVEKNAHTAEECEKYKGYWTARSAASRWRYTQARDRFGRLDEQAHAWPTCLLSVNADVGWQFGVRLPIA